MRDFSNDGRPLARPVYRTLNWLLESHLETRRTEFYPAIPFRWADLLLFGVTSVELGVLIFLTPNFLLVDWIYILQHVTILGIALTRGVPERQDRSLLTGLAVVICYTYSYTQVIYLGLVPGSSVWPDGALVLVTLSACLSFVSLVSLGRLFGVRPAYRGLATKGPYQIVRHPMYLAYVIGDVGYALDDANIGSVLMVLVGWGALMWRIRAEERVLFYGPGWPVYAASVRYRLVPGIW
jgi:protein-S-isoprenylcysteine O-methyltransferase Ste14